MSKNIVKTMQELALQSRKKFTQVYGVKTVGIVTDLARNRTVKTIVKTRKANKRTVAAVKANLTRGTYADYAKVDRYGVFGPAYAY